MSDAKHTPGPAAVSAAIAKVNRSMSEDPMVRAADALADALVRLIDAYTGVRRIDAYTGINMGDAAGALASARSALRAAGRLP